MDPQLLRMLMHLASLAMAGLVAWALPFSPLVNIVIAAVVFLIDGGISEAIFNRLATPAQRARDLRDRVDNPPS